MKPFEERYQDFFKKITTPKQMQIQIKETILNQKKSKKHTFRLAIAVVILAFLLISSIVGVTAYTFVKHHKTVKNNEYFKSVEVYQDKIDADVNVSDIKDKKNYTRSEIENLFGIKILKNNFIKSDQFKLHSFLENNQKITNVAFDYLDSPHDLDIFFGVYTKYWQDKEKDNLMWIAGRTKDIEYYYIPSLDTEAVIFETTSETGFILIDFIYDNVGYDIHIEKYFWSKEEIYQFLNSFYL